MKIRKATTKDARKISNLIRKCLTEVNSKTYSKKVIKGLYDFFTPSLILKNLKDRIILIAVEKINIIGTASLKGDTAFTVFVNPKSHKKGIGKELMGKVENLAKLKGYKKIKVPSSLNAVKFYKKIGYKIVKRIRSRNHGDTINMEKKLK